MNHIVNGLMAVNSNQDPVKKDDSLRNGFAQLVSMVLQILLVSVFGAWLWNNSVSKMFSGISKVNATQMYYLSLLIHILVPHS